MKNKYIIAEVAQIIKNWVLFSVRGNYKGFLHISDISDYFIGNLEKLFKVGNILSLKIKHVKGKNLYLDFKVDRALYLKQPFSFEIKETKNGFSNLKKFTDKEIEKWRL